jgi:electron transfer flavoprotein alpha subunit
MTSLVIAEHDNASIKGATLNTVTAAAACGGDVHVLVAGHNAGAAAAAAAQIAGVAKVIHADSEALAHGLAENVAAQVLAIAANYSHILFPATAQAKTSRPAWPPSWMWVRSAMSPSHLCRHLRAPHLRGQRHRHRAKHDGTKVITVRTTGFDAAAATGGSAAVESAAAQADSGKSSFTRSEIAKNDRPELTAAKIIVSGGRALGSSEKFNEVMTPWPTSWAPPLVPAALRWTRATRQRLASGPDRQDRRAPAVCRLRHLGCDPALGGHEGFQGDRGDQQGPRSTDLQRGRLWPRSRFVCRRA